MVDVGLGSHDTALRLRRIIRQAIDRELEQSGANPQLATVTSIDADNFSCRVRFRAEADDVLVKMGAVQPTQIGQTVRVQGPPSDLWVVDVVGDAALTGETSANLGAPINLTVVSVGLSLVVDWIGVAFADRYEVQFTDTTTSTTVSAQTITSRYTIDGLIEDESYTVRVRAVSSSGNVGPWTTFGSAVTVGGFPTQPTTDGQPPASSPQAVCTSGIGTVFVEWQPIANPDLVTYEIYADFESGFTPAPANKLGETTGTFWVFRRLANGTQLPYDNHTFVRIIARDVDGAAPAGAQGFATADQVNSDDFGSVTDLAISDGQAPNGSPQNVTVTAGIGYLFLTWDEVANDDEVTYEVHMSTGTPFTPTANTLVGETKGSFIFLRERPPGFGGGPITYETTYYITVWARDKDGYAPASSPVVTGTSLKTGTGDIQGLAITSALIADLAVGQAKIQDAAITTAKIIDGAITNAKIGLAAIGTANIATAAIGTAQIADASITSAKVASLSADVINAGTINGIDITGSNITGSTLNTADSGQRIVITSDGFVEYHSGHTSELTAGFVRAGVGNTPFGNDAGFITMASPQVTTQGANSGALFEMWNDATDGAQIARITADLYMHGQIIMDNSGEFSVAASPGGTERLNINSSDISMSSPSGTERMSIAQTQTSIFYSSGNREFRLQPDGDAVIYNVSTSLWNAGTGGISDERMKKSILAIDPEARALRVLRRIPLIEFEFTGLSQDGRHAVPLPAGKRIGVSAQKVMEVFRQGVSCPGGDPRENNLLIDAHSMLALTIGSIQALDAKVTALEATAPTT